MKSIAYQRIPFQMRQAIKDNLAFKLEALIYTSFLLNDRENVTAHFWGSNGFPSRFDLEGHFQDPR